MIEDIYYLVVICLKIRTFVVSATTYLIIIITLICCDLLENSYLCGISNNRSIYNIGSSPVVICLKIRTFVVSATTASTDNIHASTLWFAWKFVPLWYQQQPIWIYSINNFGCDLLENSYLCGISNNLTQRNIVSIFVVICLKIRTFVVSATTARVEELYISCCDLLENSYLCGISNNSYCPLPPFGGVVICLKIRTFVVSATTTITSTTIKCKLWFAWKFVPLWYQQQRWENLNISQWVVICLKIRTFVVSATTISINFN